MGKKGREVGGDWGAEGPKVAQRKQGGWGTWLEGEGVSKKHKGIKYVTDSWQKGT